VDVVDTGAQPGAPAAAAGRQPPQRGYLPGMARRIVPATPSTHVLDPRLSSQIVYYDETSKSATRRHLPCTSSTRNQTRFLLYTASYKVASNIWHAHSTASPRRR